MNIRISAAAAASAGAALAVLGTASAQAATVISVQGTKIVTPATKPQQIVPALFDGDTIQDIDYPASVIGMGSSIDQGADTLDATIAATPGVKVVTGFSQGAVVVAREKQRLMAMPADQRPSTNDLTFVTIGDPTNPHGIMRYIPAGVTIPILGVTSVSAPDTPYETVVINREYDGWADTPDHPLNLVADANAVAGIVYIHSSYADADLDLSTVPAEDITTTTNSLGGKTTAYLVPTKNLPLVQPLRDIGIPEPVVEAVEKPLRKVVDAGYDRTAPPPARRILSRLRIQPV